MYAKFGTRTTCFGVFGAFSLHLKTDTAKRSELNPAKQGALHNLNRDIIIGLYLGALLRNSMR